MFHSVALPRVFDSRADHSIRPSDNSSRCRNAVQQDDQPHAKSLQADSRADQRRRGNISGNEPRPVLKCYAFISIYCRVRRLS